MGIRAEGVGPLGSVLGIAPGRPAHLDDLLGGLGEDRDGGFPELFHSLAFLGQRVPSLADEAVVLGRQFPGFGQGHGGIAAQPDVVALSTDGDPLHPPPGPGGHDLEVQAVAVGIHAGPGDGADEDGREGLLLYFAGHPAPPNWYTQLYT